MQTSPIEWLKRPGTRPCSWNPGAGCKEQSPGCRECYAKRLVATRLSLNPKLPMYKGLARLSESGHPQWSGEFRFFPERLYEPFSAQASCTVFVGDMTDLFGYTFEQIAAVLAVAMANPHHTFILLTKQIERAAAFFEWVERESVGKIRRQKTVLAQALSDVLDLPNTGLHAALGAGALDGLDRKKRYRSARVANLVELHHTQNTAVGWPLPNVWVGASAENQEYATKRHPFLRSIPAVVRFWSLEPLLGPIPNLPMDGISWAIMGGESGSDARAADVEWFLEILAQVEAAGAAPFMKQLGAKPYKDPQPTGNFRTYQGRRQLEMKATPIPISNKKGSNPDDFPERLQVRRFPR
jgi:protein gp37